MSKKNKPEFINNKVGEFNINYRRTDEIMNENMYEEYREKNAARKIEIEGKKDYHKDGIVYRLFSSYNFLDPLKEIITTKEDIKSFKYGYIDLANLQLEELASKIKKGNDNFYANESIISILNTILKTGKATINGMGKKTYSSKEKLYLKTIIKLINGPIPESKEERDNAIEKRKIAVNELLYKIGQSDAINEIIIPSEKYPLITANDSYTSGYSSILEIKNKKTNNIK